MMENAPESDDDRVSQASRLASQPAGQPARQKRKAEQPPGGSYWATAELNCSQRNWACYHRSRFEKAVSADATASTGKIGRPKASYSP